MTSFVGIGLFVGAYGVGVAVLADSPGYESRRLLLPVFGPIWENRYSDYIFNGSRALAALDTVVQLTGLTLFGVGLRRDRYAVYYVTTERGRTLAFSPEAGPRTVALRMTF